MAVRVKIRKDAVVAALNERLVTAAKAEKEQEAIDKEYDKAVAKYVTEILALVKKGSISAHQASHRTWRKQVEMSFSYEDESVLPTEPQMGNRAEGTLAKHEIEEINKNIKLLSMCDDEYLSASLYKDVVKYL